MLGDNRVFKGVGHLWLGNVPIYEVTNFSMPISVEGFEAQLRNGIYIVPTFMRYSLNIETASYSADLLAVLTGGALSTGSLRIKDETLTKSTNTLTLGDTPEDIDRLLIYPVAANTAPLVKVASSPAVGEFSISGTTVTLNVAEAASDFQCIYPYNDGSNGQTLQINPNSLPNTLYKFFGYGGIGDAYTSQNGHLGVHLAKVQRSLGEFTIGFQAGSQQNISFQMNVLNNVAGDVKLYDQAA